MKYATSDGIVVKDTCRLFESTIIQFMPATNRSCVNNVSQINSKNNEHPSIGMYVTKLSKCITALTKACISGNDIFNCVID